MVSRIFFCAALALLAGEAGAQAIKTYTQSPSGANSRPLGYPVPLPIASLTPVDGFRDYASLHARHQQLDLESPDITGQVVGATQGGGRPIWAYTLGDADSLTVDGEREPSAIVNATTHAREWQAPEVSTGIMEYLAANAGDRGVVRYLIDNFHIVIIPVHNIDGFLQTQRYPTQAIVGADPQGSADTPRDGRMRRKNMRGVDEVLTTFADHLFGVDLNRNHAPYFGPNSSGSGRGQPDPRFLTYYGTAVHSEAENVALDAAIALANPTRLRLGVDIHSFGKVFFSSNTGMPRLNAIQAELIAHLQSHHAAATLARGFSNNVFYAEVPDPVGAGLGAAAEFFSERFHIPAWTLELEPTGNGARDYGGIGDSHDGFILPAAEIRRVREVWAQTQTLAFYHQAGPPYLAQVEVRDVASGETRYRASWLRGAAGRVLVVARDMPLLAGGNYRAVLRFSKPMRVRESGAVVQFPGQGVPLDPALTLDAGTSALLPTAGTGRWLDADMARYRDDSYSAAFTVAASAAAPVTLRVAAQDLAALALDAKPQTPVDWDAAWSGYEGTSGLAGDAGGEDRNHVLRLAASEPGRIAATLESARVREGGYVRVVLNRQTPGPATTVQLRVLPLVADTTDFEAALPEARWGAGEIGVRRVALRVLDDGVTEGREAVLLKLAVTQGEAALFDAALQASIEDALRFDIE